MGSVKLEQTPVGLRLEWPVQSTPAKIYTVAPEARVAEQLQVVGGEIMGYTTFVARELTPPAVQALATER